jgi:hypothetical protein
MGTRNKPSFLEQDSMYSYKQWEIAIKILDKRIDIPVTKSVETKACSELDFIDHFTIY